MDSEECAIRPYVDLDKVVMSKVPVKLISHILINVSSDLRSSQDSSIDVFLVARHSERVCIRLVLRE